MKYSSYQLKRSYKKSIQTDGFLFRGACLAFFIFSLTLPLIPLSAPADTNKIEETWDQLKGYSKESEFGTDFGWMKYVIDKSSPTKPVLYLQDSNRYLLHFDFVRSFPGNENLSKEQFRIMSQSPEGRRYLVGTVRFKKTSITSVIPQKVEFDVVSTSVPQPEEVQLAYSLLNSRIKDLEADFRYKPLAQFLAATNTYAGKLKQLGVPTDFGPSTSEVFVYSEGWKVGMLEKLRSWLARI